MGRTKTNAALQICELTQDLSPEHWLDNSSVFIDILEQANKGDIVPLMSYLQANLIKNGLWVTEMHGIIHNKDTLTQWSERDKKEILVCKSIHIHIVMRFSVDEKYRGTLYDIAKACCVEPQYIEKPKKGRYAYDDMLSYLTHTKDEDKFQYTSDEVKSLITMDNNGNPLDSKAKPFSDIYAERYTEWLKGRAVKRKKKAIADIDTLIMQILNGEVTRSQVLLTDELYLIYSYNKRKVDDAFEMYENRKAVIAGEAIRKGEIQAKVIFITGPSGAGKSRFATEFAMELCTRNPDWSVCNASAKNPVDEYHGEEILLMNDVRSCTLSPMDWLKLLDPYDTSPTSARYHNKQVTAQFIIITSTLEPATFFADVCRMHSMNEDMRQFIRRLSYYVEVIPYTEGDYDYDKSLINIHCAKTEIVDGNRTYGFGIPYPAEPRIAKLLLCDLSKS